MTLICSRTAGARREHSAIMRSPIRADGRAMGPTAGALRHATGRAISSSTIDGREREFLSYSARGPGARDDGTLAPTAMASSIAFEPGWFCRGWPR